MVDYARSVLAYTEVRTQRVGIQEHPTISAPPFIIIEFEIFWILSGVVILVGWSVNGTVRLTGRH